MVAPRPRARPARDRGDGVRLAARTPDGANTMWSDVTSRSDGRVRRRARPERRPASRRCCTSCSASCRSAPARATVLGRAARRAKRADRLPAAAPRLRREHADPRHRPRPARPRRRPLGRCRCPARPERARRRVAEAIELVGAAAYARRPIGECSGGEQQRLLIAQALVARPAAAPRRAARQPRPAEPGLRRGAVARICREQGMTRAAGRARREPDARLPRPRRLPRGRRGPSGAPARGHHHRDAERASTASPVEVLRTSDGRLVVVGQPEAPAHHHDRHGTDARMARHLPLAAPDGPQPSSDLRQLLAYPFMVNALEAGTIVAVIAGVIGWFMVLRRETFAGHTLSVMAFPGAAAPRCSGCPPRVGLPHLLRRRRARDRRGRRRQRGDTAARSPRSSARCRPPRWRCGFLFVSLYSGSWRLREPAVRQLPRHHRRAGAHPRDRRRRCRWRFFAVDRPAAAVRLGRRACRARAWVPVRALSSRVPARCSGSRSRRPRRSPARCSSSRCSSCRPRPRSRSRRGSALSLALTVALGLAVTWLGLASPTSPPIPSASSSPTIAFAVYVSPG